jgi:hypothetical protein
VLGIIRIFKGGWDFFREFREYRHDKRAKRFEWEAAATTALDISLQTSGPVIKPTYDDDYHRLGEDFAHGTVGRDAEPVAD